MTSRESGWLLAEESFPPRKQQIADPPSLEKVVFKSFRQVGNGKACPSSCQCV